MKSVTQIFFFSFWDFVYSKMKTKEWDCEKHITPFK